MSTAGFKFDNTLGALFLGTSLSMSLWGIACVQTYDYFLDDGGLQRLVVGLLLALNTFTVTLNIHMCYYFLATNYANPFSLLNRPWSLGLVGAFMGIMTSIIRTMFARRIYQFGGKNKLVTTWIMAFTIAGLVIDIMIVVKSFSNISSLEIQRLSFVYFTVGLGLVVDLSIPIALFRLLRSARTGFRRSNSIINTLMWYAVNTGLLVLIGSAAGTILYVAMPESNMIYFAVFMVYHKLYVNAYLASLNARSRFRTREHIPNCYPLSGSSSRGMSSSGVDKSSNGVGVPTMAISLHTIVEHTVDD